MTLEVEKLRVAYGPIVAVHDLNLTLPQGGAFALLGPNGAGKTSAVEAIVGLIPSAAGRVIFEGTVLTGRSTSDIVRRGLTLVPQWRDLFAAFTVEETLLAGAAAARSPWRAPARRGAPARRRAPMPLDEVYEVFPVLGERRRQVAGSLSGGEQQVLAVARALVARPRALLLDEPSAGLAAGVLRDLVPVVNRIRASGVAVLLVEQNLELARALADRCIVLAAGRKVFEGSMQGERDLADIGRAYFA
jgi:branched-chain amino acid transport system ATP-binding protein